MSLCVGSIESPWGIMPDLDFIGQPGVLRQPGSSPLAFPLVRRKRACCITCFGGFLPPVLTDCRRVVTLGHGTGSAVIGGPALPDLSRREVCLGGCML
jgi:hypothetical protein